MVDSTDVGDARAEEGEREPPGSGQTDASSRSAGRRGRPSDEEVIGPEDVDTAPAGRLAECRQVLESVLASADTVGVPILVLANKQDREDCVETVRIKEGLVRPVFEGEKGGGVRDSRVLPVSALTGAGVKEAVEWVRSRVKGNREARPPAMR